MTSSISRRKRNYDRISNLPDNVITNILSSLSTKEAVKTSILSTSWNKQWTLVPFICFDESLPWHKIYSRSFVNFLNRVLRFNVTSLELFQLTCRLYGSYCGVYKDIDISNWISGAISRHVRQIVIHATMPSNCRLPDSLYSSKTLVVLKLKGNFVFQVPKKISLESLKIFHYDVDNYVVSESPFRLVSSCPVLEELQIIGKLETNVKVVNISSLVLRRLILEDKHSSQNEHAYKFVLNTLNLQYLELDDKYGVIDSYPISTLHCLDIAHFRLYPDNYEFDQLGQTRLLAELVKAISNVRVLYILKDSIVITLPNFELPKFDRLIYLDFGSIYLDAGFRMLFSFLQNSRLLESLSFYMDCWDETWNPPTDVPLCMIYNLKIIKVGFCDEEEPVLNHVLTYFLEKTNCLKELILHPEEKGEEFIKKLSMLPRASNSCRIVLT